MYEQYEHNGRRVWVRSDLKEMYPCYHLCLKCQEYKPERSREQNCKIANAVSDICDQYGIVMPVFECPAFKSSV